MTARRTLPIILAHRGFHRRFKENTRAAVVAALDIGSHGVEIDVRTTADGKRVLFHDRTYRRRPIAGLTFAQLPAWVPTLASILRRTKPWPGFLVNVELKESKVDRALLSELREARHLVVTSFQLDAVRVVHRGLPRVPVGWLRERPSTREVTAAAAAGCSIVVVHRRGLTPALAKHAARRSVALWVWGVNRVSQAREAVRVGVSAIITDRPDRLLKADLGHPAPRRKSRRTDRREN